MGVHANLLYRISLFIKPAKWIQAVLFLQHNNHVCIKNFDSIWPFIPLAFKAHNLWLIIYTLKPLITCLLFTLHCNGHLSCSTIHISTEFKTLYHWIFPLLAMKSVSIQQTTIFSYLISYSVGGNWWWWAYWFVRLV